MARWKIDWFAEVPCVMHKLSETISISALPHYLTTKLPDEPFRNYNVPLLRDPVEQEP
jgi:hypothetical protein